MTAIYRIHNDITGSFISTAYCPDGTDSFAPIPVSSFVSEGASRTSYFIGVDPSSYLTSQTDIEGVGVAVPSTLEAAHKTSPLAGLRFGVKDIVSTLRLVLARPHARLNPSALSSTISQVCELEEAAELINRHMDLPTLQLILSENSRVQPECSSTAGSC
jgi:hypothetical protein